MKKMNYRSDSFDSPNIKSSFFLFFYSNILKTTPDKTRILLEILAILDSSVFIYLFVFFPPVVSVTEYIQLNQMEKFKKKKKKFFFV